MDTKPKFCMEKHFNFRFDFVKNAHIEIKRERTHLIHGGCCVVVVSTTSRIAIKIKAAGCQTNVRRLRMRTFATFHYLSLMPTKRIQKNTQMDIS